MQANNEAADELIPLKQKIKRIRASKDPGVVEAREKVNAAFKQYQKNPTEDYRTKLQAALENLKTAYNDIKEKELEGMIKKVEEADSKSQHGESWKLINEISGRKPSKKGILKGKSQEERIKAWSSIEDGVPAHFSHGMVLLDGTLPPPRRGGTSSLSNIWSEPRFLMLEVLAHFPICGCVWGTSSLSNIWKRYWVFIYDRLFKMRVSQLIFNIGIW